MEASETQQGRSPHHLPAPTRAERPDVCARTCAHACRRSGHRGAETHVRLGAGQCAASSSPRQRGAIGGVRAEASLPCSCSRGVCVCVWLPGCGCGPSEQAGRQRAAIRAAGGRAQAGRQVGLAAGGPGAAVAWPQGCPAVLAARPVCAAGAACDRGCLEIPGRSRRVQLSCVAGAGRTQLRAACADSAWLPRLAGTAAPAVCMLAQMMGAAGGLIGATRRRAARFIRARRGTRTHTTGPGPGGHTPCNGVRSGARAPRLPRLARGPLPAPAAPARGALSLLELIVGPAFLQDGGRPGRTWVARRPPCMRAGGRAPLCLPVAA